MKKLLLLVALALGFCLHADAQCGPGQVPIAGNRGCRNTGAVVVKDATGSVVLGTATLGPKTIAAGANQVPTAAECARCVTILTDGQNAADTTLGGGTTPVLAWSNGTAWVPIVAGSTSYPGVTSDGDSGLIVDKKLTVGSIELTGTAPWNPYYADVPTENPTTPGTYFFGMDSTGKTFWTLSDDGLLARGVRPGSCPTGQVQIGISTLGALLCGSASEAPDKTLFRTAEDFDRFNPWTGAKLGTTAWSAPTQGQSTGSHWGIASLATSDAAVDNGFQYYPATSTQRNIPRLDAASDIVYESFESTWIFKLTTAANYTARIGFTETLGNIAPNNFFGLRYVAGTDTTLMLETRIAGTPTEAAGLPLNITHWYKLTFASSAKGAMTITLYDYDADTTATYDFAALPAVATVPWIAVQQSAAQFTSAALDYVSVYATGLVR